jgi:hypothetical protein
MRAIFFTAALCLSVAIPTWRVSAQSDAGDGTVGDVVCHSAINQELFADPPVLNAPFSAEVTTVWRPVDGRPEMRATAYYYRDSAGQVRVEQMLGGNQRQTVIVKPKASKWAYVLDSLARTNTPVGRGIANMITGAGACDDFVLPVTTTRFISFYIHGPQVLYPTLADDESLGTRSIAGVQATGTRFTMVLPGHIWKGQGERWISPELELVVSSHGENPQIGTIDYEMVRISRAEPQAELFQVPADYAERSPNALWPSLCWQNPYNVPMIACKVQAR